MPLQSNLIDETAQFLDNHEETLRIRKILFCLCKKYWENNQTILSAFSLSKLIQDLIRTYPTINEFQVTLVKLVKTLNRPNVYTGVAKILYEKISRIYQQLEEEKKSAIVTNISNTSSSQALTSVAVKLHNHQERSRIKKVIYSVCRKRWENDSTVLESYDLKSLLGELLKVYPTQDALQNALNKLIQNINKQNLYLAIANIIINQISILYSDRQEDPNLEPEGSTQIINTQIIHVNNSFNLAPNSVEAQPIVRQENFSNSVIDVTPQPIAAQLESADFHSFDSESLPQVEQPKKSFNSFEVRIEIMQYTNPLRAKVLLFSVLYQTWDKNNQDWATLRSYTLDDLLKQLVQTARNLTEIETKLYSAARNLTDFDANMQTASTITEAIKPYLTNN
jgi:hypothetical protein